MKKLLLTPFLLLSACYAGWTPLAVVPADGRAASLGKLALADASNMPAAGTEVSLRRDGKALYLQFRCEEPSMQKIKMSCQDRDSQVWGDDCLEVFLKPSGWKDYAHLVVNAAGAQYDELNRDKSWDLEWSVEVKREEAAWCGTITVPFEKLGGAPAEGAEWRANFCRQRLVVSELSSWSPTGSFHDYDNFGTVRFANGPSAKSISWSNAKTKSIDAKVTWNDPATKAALSVNGTALNAQGQYGLTQAGVTPLHLEASVGGKAVLRSQYVLKVTPLATLAAETKAMLGNANDPEIKNLLGQVEALAALSENASIASLPLLEEEAQRIQQRANFVKIRKDFAANGGKERQLVYGVDTSLRKHLRHHLFRGQVGGGVHLDAARNEMDAAQILLFTEDDSVLKVQAKAGEFKGQGGAVLPASAIRVRRVAYVQTIKPVYKVEYSGQWPDPLMALTPFDIFPYSFETLWLDVRVPVGTKPGLYKGQLTLTALNRNTTTVPVEIRVRNFTIPAKPSIITAFGLSPNRWGKHDYNAYFSNFMEHRITPYTCVPAPKLVELPYMDWRKATALKVTVKASRNCKLTGSILAKSGAKALPVSDVEGGKTTEIVFKADQLPLDFVSNCTFVVPCEEASLSATLLKEDGTTTILVKESTQYPVFNGDWLGSWPTWRVEDWQKPDCPAVFDWTEFDEKFQRALDRGITSHIATLKSPLGLWSAEYQRHLGEKGWLKYFYTYLYDEPEPDKYPLVNDRLSQVKLAGDARLMNMMTARSFPPELPYVDIWCPELYSFNPELCKAEQAKGRNVWWYVAFSTRHPYPDVWIDYPAVDCRVWPWMTWKHDIDGMLYWSVTAWSRNNPWCSGETFPRSNGDGSILYPGDDGKPVDCIRWECLRDGMEDYEVFCMLEAAARELGEREPELRKEIARLCSIDQSVLVSYKNYNEDPKALLKARAEMSDCLEKAVAVLGHEPVIQNRPRHRPGVTKKEAWDAYAKARITPLPTVKKKLDYGEIVEHPAEGLVLSYDFEGNYPFIADASGFSRMGMPFGCRRVPGHTGQGLETKTGAYLVLPTGAELFGSYAKQGTVEFWVKPNFAPDSLVGDDDGFKGKFSCLFYLMETDGNGLPDGYDEIGIYLRNQELRMRCGGQYPRVGSIPTPLKKDVWTHLALTWKEGVVSLYVNGKEAKRLTGAYPPAGMDAFAGTLGAHTPAKRFPFAGAFDDLRIWNRCLAPEEVAAHAK